MRALHSPRQALAIAFLCIGLGAFGYILIQNFQTLTGTVISRDVNGNAFALATNTAHGENIELEANRHGLITCPVAALPPTMRWSTPDDYAHIGGMRIYEFSDDYAAEKSGAWTGLRYGFGQNQAETLQAFAGEKTYYVRAPSAVTVNCSRPVAPSSSSSAQASSADPVGYWPLEENGGTQMIEALHGRHGTFTGAVAWQTSTVPGSSYALNTLTTTGGAVLPDIPELNFSLTTAFSLSFWIRKTVAASPAAPILISDSANGGLPGWLIGSFGNDNIGIAFNFTRASAATQFPVISESAFTHILMTYDGSGFGTGITVFANGIPQPMNASTMPAAPGAIENISPIRFGWGSLGYLYDDIRIYRDVVRLEDIPGAAQEN